MSTSREPFLQSRKALDLREQIVSLALSSEQEHLASFDHIAVLSGCGDTETGFHNDPRFCVTQPLEAVSLLDAERELVTQQFLTEIGKIADGVREGHYVDDGSEQFAIALIVADRGAGKPLMPLSGISVCCNPAVGRRLIIKKFRVDDAWDDFATREVRVENEPSKIDEATLQAYRDAIYRVGCEPPFCLKVDQRSPDLKRLYGEYGVQSAAFLTAFNPFGRQLSKKVNEVRQRQLRSDLERADLAFIEGIGCDPTGRWEGEPSFLAFGMSADQAGALGKQYGQNAIVWAARDAVPKLVLLR